MCLGFETHLSNSNDRERVPASNASDLADAIGGISENIVKRWIDRQRPFWRTESTNELAPPPPFTGLTDPAAIISFGTHSPRLAGCLLLPPIYRGTPEKELALRGQRCLHLMSKAPRFEEIFLPHLDAAYNLAHWILGDEREAEDVVREAYARAWEDFSIYRGENPRVWLLTIVRAIASSRPGQAHARHRSGYRR
jgi:hypothetical protein